MTTACPAFAAYPRSGIRRRRSVRLLGSLLVATAAIAGAAVTAPASALSAGRPSSPGGKASQLPTGWARLIVRVSSGRFDAAAAASRAAGGRVVARQPALGMFVAEGPAGLAGALAGVPGVTGVTPDGSVRLNSLGFDPATQPGSMTRVTALTGATGLWAAGYTGAGVDVALIDTGVAPVAGLRDPAKVVVGPDLSFESQSSDTRYLDTYGHGTHMAGIIAGREVARASGASYAADTTNFYGMAPDSRLVSLKLADHNGLVDISQIVAAVDWVAQFGKSNGLNVRVLNLSFGVDSPQSPQVDPLSWAAEVAWKRGIVVVASVGNQGDSYAGLNSPAYNPWVLAVGAVDTMGTTTVSDDVIPSFSAVQGGNFNNRGPDLVAPGKGIVSLNVPGSTISNSFPAARVASSFLRGSGTSQAAAVVSGAAALLLQQRPTLTPNQVKALLMNSATPVTGVSRGSQGAGELNLAAAAATATPTSLQSPVSGNGTGSLESARGGKWVEIDGWNLVGELDIFNGQWQGSVIGPKTGTASMWSADGSTWQGSMMTGAGFTADTTTWAGKTWSGKTWTGKSWTGKSWTGKSWSGISWTGKTWTGTGWSSASWSTPVGASSGWASGMWSTGDWK
jgi:serine protease AprX